MSRKKSPIDQKKLKKFGERLKSLRLSLNMSQRKFAKTIGISRKKTTIGKNNLKKIGGRIKSLQFSTGLNQADFGKSIGISQSSVSDLIRGLYPPSNPTLLAIHDQYSVKPEEILTGEGFCLNKVKYRSTKEELGPSSIYEPTKEELAPTNPVKQIVKGFTQLFNDQKKEFEKLHDMCEKVERRISDLEEQLRQSPPGEAGNHEDIIKKSAT